MEGKWQPGHGGHRLTISLSSTFLSPQPITAVEGRWKRKSFVIAGKSSLFFLSFGEDLPSSDYNKRFPNSQHSQLGFSWSGITFCQACLSLAVIP